MLQAAVAEIRGYEITVPEDPEADEAAAHRRWRRRMHADDHSGDHQIVAAEETPLTGLAPEPSPAGVAESVPEGSFDALTSGDAAEVEAEAEADVDIDVADEVPLAVEVEPEVEPEVEVADDGEVAAAAVAASLTEAPESAGEPESAGQPDATAAEDAEPTARTRWRRRGVAAATIAAAANGEAVPDELDEVAGAHAEQRLPRRRRGVGRPSTVSSPTAAYVLAIDQTAAGPAGPIDDTDDGRSGRGRAILVAAVVALLIVAGITVAVTTSGSDDEVASPPAKVQPRLEFAPVTTPDGVSVTRVWKLDGAQGDEFTGSLKFTNPTSSAITTTFTEVIPKSLAPSVSSITFDPQPVVVKADPVVQYTETIAPGDTFVATYEIAVPATGATRERLLKWSEDLAAETGTTTTTTLPPVTTTEAPTTTAPASTSPPSVTTRPVVTTPTTAAPPPPTTTAPPPADGFIWMSVNNNGANEASFTFSNGTTLTVPSQGLASSALISVPPGSHLVSLTTGVTDGIACSGHSSGSGNTANYDVAPGETVGCTWTAHNP